MAVRLLTRVDNVTYRSGGSATGMKKIYGQIYFVPVAFSISMLVDVFSTTV